MNARFVPILLFVSLLFQGCVVGPVTPPMSALQVRSLQTREYETADTQLVMKAVLNTLQDRGFVTRNAVPELGLISAIKESDMQTRDSEIWNSILIGSDGAWIKQQVVEATANVTRIGRSTRVRVSFQKKVLSNRGDIVEITELLDSMFYQDFFSSIEKGVFLQEQQL